MANGFIQVPADSTGKKIQTFENTVNANVVEAEAVVLVDNSGANACNVNGSGQLPVAVGNTPSVNQGTSPWLTRQNDGTNTETTLFDVDSGGVTHQFVQGISLRKSSSGGSVELGTGTNPIRVDPTGTTTQPVSGTVTANAGTNLNTSALALESGGNLATIAGTVAASKVNVNISSGSIANTGFNSTVLTATSGGYTTKHVVAAATTNAQNVKASAGQLYGWSIFNNTTYPVFVKLHNTAGTPTAGSGVVQTIGVQAGVGTYVFNVQGIPFSTGIGMSIVKDITDAGATAVALNDCVVDLFYA